MKCRQRRAPIGLLQRLLSFDCAIACPVLLIVGEHDMFAPKTLVDDLAAQIANIETVEALGAGHAVHHARPEWFIQTAVDWLARH